MKINEFIDVLENIKHISDKCDVFVHDDQLIVDFSKKISRKEFELMDKLCFYVVHTFNISTYEEYMEDTNSTTWATYFV